MKPEFPNRTYTRRDVIKLAGISGAAVVGAGLLAGCSSGTSSSAASASSASQASSTSSASASSAASSTSAASLDGAQLNIYCGAGMTDPFQEIADAFEDETKCAMNITFANAAQIQTQINTTQEGDYFIAGSAEEVKPVEQYVETSTPLVKHIPVIAVPTANPKGIASLADLANVDSLLIGDPESTPIGKIAKKALTDAGIWDALQQKGAITTTTTAPQIASALASGEGDAGIVWKENVKANGATILDTADMDSYVKTIPAARLTFVKNADAASAFDAFLQTAKAQDIWKKYGYELA